MATYASKLRKSAIDNSTIKLNTRGEISAGLPEPRGNVFYVDSVSGRAADDGKTWASATTTLDAAIDKCTADNGDVIYVSPHHVETEAGVDTSIWTMDTAGVSIIGLTQGISRPTFTFTDDGATATVSAANCVISGCKFVSGVIDLAACITASAAADGLVIDDCIFRDGSAVLEIVDCISLATTLDDVTIQNCKFFTTDAGSGTLTAISCVGVVTRLTVQDCYFRGDWNTSVIDGSTSAGFDVLIQRNTINNLDAVAGLTVSLNAATTGAVVYNNCHGGKNGTHMAAAGCLLAQNYETNAEGAQGFYGTAQDS